MSASGRDVSWIAGQVSNWSRYDHDELLCRRLTTFFLCALPGELRSLLADYEEYLRQHEDEMEADAKRRLGVAIGTAKTVLPTLDKRWSHRHRPPPLSDV